MPLDLDANVEGRNCRWMQLLRRKDVGTQVSGRNCRRTQPEVRSQFSRSWSWIRSREVPVPLCSEPQPDLSPGTGTGTYDRIHLNFGIKYYIMHDKIGAGSKAEAVRTGPRFVGAGAEPEPKSAPPPVPGP